MEESTGIVLALIVTLVLSYVIAELFGRTKHIGFGWTFAISASTGFIGGLIALAVSPSTIKNPTSGGSGYKIAGWICIAFGTLNFFMFNPLTLGFFILGGYLLKLGSGEIVNHNPKFFLSKIGASGSRQSNNLFSRISSKSTSVKEKKEYLQNLYNKGLLSHEEFAAKINSLKEIELEEKVKISHEFNQLSSLLSSGILTKNEFDQKIQQLRLEIKQSHLNYEQRMSDHATSNSSVNDREWKVFFYLSIISGIVAIVWYLTLEGILFTWSNPYF